MAGEKFWSSEKLIGLSALFVSLLTLAVFIYQTNLIRKQQYMSVYPYLSLGNKYSGTMQYEYVVKNEGIGPAMIDSIMVESPDGKIFESLIDYVSTIAPNPDSIWYFYSDLNPGLLVPAGDEIPLVSFVNDQILEELGIEPFEGMPENSLLASKALFDILNHDSLVYKIFYSSIYDEKWLLQNQTGKAVAID